MSQQQQVAQWAINLAQQNFSYKWTNNPANSSLTIWAAENLNSPNPGPLPPLTPDLTMTCYELPLYGAAATGAISLLQLLNIYKQVYVSHKTWDVVLNGYWFSSPTSYDVNSHSPLIPKGNTVFFNDVAHICISTGNRTNFGNQEVVSFWGLVPRPGEGVRTPVTIDSAEALAEIIKTATNSPVTIGFANAPW